MGVLEIKGEASENKLSVFTNPLECFLSEMLISRTPLLRGARKVGGGGASARVSVSWLLNFLQEMVQVEHGVTSEFFFAQFN